MDPNRLPLITVSKIGTVILSSTGSAAHQPAAAAQRSERLLERPGRGREGDRDVGTPEVPDGLTG